ncbi:MAG: hypothetical protein H0W84_02530 [Bacteroidetes bacterium]|nr:hypothetical protein [Bacteroidota bacterium]
MKYLIILFILFVFASSKEITASKNTNCQDTFVSAISEENSTSDTDHITILKGILECPLKVNENHAPSFPNFKNNKKILSIHLFNQHFT